jgi:hypothetical protein
MWLSAHQQKDENQPQRANFSQFATRNSLFSEDTLSSRRAGRVDQQLPVARPVLFPIHRDVDTPLIDQPATVPPAGNEQQQPSQRQQGKSNPGLRIV